MGSGIAQVAATAGHSVVLFDTKAEALSLSKSKLTSIMDRLVEKGINSRFVNIILVISKWDLSGKGGVAAAIQKELGITPRFIGTGEEPERFERFKRERFVEKIL